MDLTKQNTQSQIIKSLIVIFLGSILLAISAKLKIPFYPGPMTMQTFIVLFLGVSFGYKIGLATVGLYLLEGIIGFRIIREAQSVGNFHMIDDHNPQDSSNDKRTKFTKFRTPMDNGPAVHHLERLVNNDGNVRKRWLET